MPDNVATAPLTGDAEALRQQIMSEDATRLEKARKPDEPAAKDGKDTPNEPAGEKETGAEEKPGETSAATPPPAEKAGEGEEKDKTEGEEPKDKKPPEAAKEEDEEKKSWKIGNREFTDFDKAVTEVNRVVGKNANLVGERDAAVARAEAAEAKAKEALEANAQWSAYYKGERKEMPEGPKPEDIAAKVADEIEGRTAKRTAAQALEAEKTEVQALGNWDEAEDTASKLLDKTNPLTGRNYSPKEAYRAACLHLGLDDLSVKKPEAETTPPKPAAPKKASTVQSAAARPSGAATSKPSVQKKGPDAIDDALNARSAML